ncbi:BTAD domain-containing putative transcriptional regulator [Streptomyces sp. YS-3]|uniref:BTAD domain-containing putative transcriptional regulator n=1 Tax=Streptomyces sp. YS-3 TaxID=3381352 RepID=UPI003862C9F7
MLGPLEVMSGGRRVPLGGVKQRATLGFLLLHANQVVPTSRLLAALWRPDSTPPTARKILQNAVWGLRGILGESGPDGAEAAEGAAELVTRAPGYLIRTDPDRIDLYVFRRQVREGRAELVGGRPEAAVASLGAALRLWRGPALADLAETGVVWPELTAVQNARRDVLEDYFEARLACGQHYAVLGELESAVEAEPLRERSSGQLMLALYRCGRQAHALAVYNRLRATLVENLGLEPGHELRRLQRAILAHDPSLDLDLAPAGPAPARPAALAPVAAADQPCERGDRRRALTAVPTHRRHGRAPERTASARPVAVPQQASVRTEVTSREVVSVLLVRAGIAPGGSPGSGGDPRSGLDEAAGQDEMLERADAVTRARIEHFGGLVVGSLGPLSLGLFQDARGGDAALRALRAAAAVREAVAPGRGLTLHAAVATGRALVRSAPGDSGGPGTPLSVNGALLDLCQRLLNRAGPGEILLCEDSRLAAGPQVSYGPADGSPGHWRLREVSARPAAPGVATAAYPTPFARPPRRIGA